MADQSTGERELLDRFLDRLEERIAQLRWQPNARSCTDESTARQEAFLDRAWEFAAELGRALPSTSLTPQERERAMGRLHTMLARIPRGSRANIAAR